MKPGSKTTACTHAGKFTTVGPQMGATKGKNGRSRSEDKARAYSGSTIAVPRSYCSQVAFFSRKCHLPRSRKGHVNCGIALKAQPATPSFMGLKAQAPSGRTPIGGVFMPRGPVKAAGTRTATHPPLLRLRQSERGAPQPAILPVFAHSQDAVCPAIHRQRAAIPAASTNTSHSGYPCPP